MGRTGFPMLRCAALAALLTGTQAFADGLGISPLNATLSAHMRAGQFTFSNDGMVPTTLQAQAYRWTRTQCVDHLEAAPDIVMSPPIFTVAPGGKQVMRVLATAAMPGTQEATWRVVLTEVRTGAASGQPGVDMRLGFSLPVFGQPAVKAAPRLDWQLSREKDGLHIRALNAGNAHTRLRAFRLADAAGKTLSEEAHADYLLAGDACSWTMPLPTLAVGLQFTAQTEAGDTSLPVP